MELKGWKYEGRKISDKLHEQILVIVEIINDPVQVGEMNWPELQSYISLKLGVATGQVRTIKRMMEEFGIIEKGSLNARDIPNSNIFTENGLFLIDLIKTEKLMGKTKNSDFKSIDEIREVYKLYYQKILNEYEYSDGIKILHPLRATLKAVDKYEYLEYFEWYLLNTLITTDDNIREEDELDYYIKEYRSGNIDFTEEDIVENKLSHSYVLGNFVYCGLVNVSGKKTKILITLNKKYSDTIQEILK